MGGSNLLDDLRHQFKTGQVLVIVGAGVSIGATRNHPVASWAGLLEDGIERCVRTGAGILIVWMKGRDLG